MSDEMKESHRRSGPGTNRRLSSRRSRRGRDRCIGLERWRSRSGILGKQRRLRSERPAHDGAGNRGRDRRPRLLRHERFGQRAHRSHRNRRSLLHSDLFSQQSEATTASCATFMLSLPNTAIIWHIAVRIMATPVRRRPRNNREDSVLASEPEPFQLSQVRQIRCLPTCSTAPPWRTNCCSGHTSTPWRRRRKPRASRWRVWPISRPIFRERRAEQASQASAPDPTADL